MRLERCGVHRRRFLRFYRAGGGRHFTEPCCNPPMPAAFWPTSVGSLWPVGSLSSLRSLICRHLRSWQPAHPFYQLRLCFHGELVHAFLQQLRDALRRNTKSVAD